MGFWRRRLAWVMLTLALLFATTLAHGDVADDVAVLTPPPVPPLVNPAPVLESGPNLAPYLNHVVLAVDVVIPPEQAGVWSDVKIPSVGVL
ncbi:MAG: hypothetical protein KF795_33875, partial [Labilithrix sp.]|nr:hypothetical protein [Labilithrix sp.]